MCCDWKSSLALNYLTHLEIRAAQFVLVWSVRYQYLYDPHDISAYKSCQSTSESSSAVGAYQQSLSFVYPQTYNHYHGSG